MNKQRVSTVSIMLLILTLVTTPALANVPGIDHTMEGAKEGLVAVSHPLGAEAGIRILKQGGNAIDAAAAIQLAMTVVEPMMSGIGGGGFMLIYLADTNEVTIIDSRETAPANVTPELFLDDEGQPIPWFERHTSGKAVGVPGTLLGLEVALEKYGTMSLAEVIQPAIEYAEKGITVNWSMAKYIEENIDKLEQYGTAAKVFVPNGKPLQEGDILVQPDLAKTLKLIQEHGTDVFYKGEIGEALVAEVQKRGGTMTMDDLANYRVMEREPVRANYRGYEIISMSPPSSGGLTVLQILKLLEGYDLKAMGLNSAEYLHHFIEATRLAYADRAAYMADEDFYPVPKEGLLNEEYISERRALLNSDRASTDITAGDPWAYESTANAMEVEVSNGEDKPDGETTHFSVIDKWGNMVAYTTTIEQVFGTGIMVPGYGFMLNNELTDFDAEPVGVNKVEPGKRPRSSMSPTLIVKDGQPFMALGSPGGPTIITSVAQTIINVIDHELPIQEAILAPRVYSSSYPQVRWEAGLDQDVILELIARGHVFDDEPQDIGNVQAIIFDYEQGKMYGGADNTREGSVMGVDAVHFISEQPAPVTLGEPAAFGVRINGALLPLTNEQVFMENGLGFVQLDKLLLSLGNPGIHASMETRVKDEQTFVLINDLAEALGYQLSWDSKERVFHLEKQEESTSREQDHPIPDEQFQITN